MKDFLEKIGSYQILTNLLPGVLFCIGINFLFGISLPADNIGEELAVCYFLGLFINRFGSLIVEPFLKKIKFLKFAPYKEFVEATLADPKVDILSETNNYLRSLVSCVILMPCAWIVQRCSLQWSWFAATWKYVALVAALTVLLLSYRKQTKYVCRRVESVNEIARKPIATTVERKR